MRNKTVFKLTLTFILLCFWIFPTSIFAQTQTIKVVKDKTNIHLYPDRTSEVIGNAPIGTEFETERKIGEWFKIEFYSQVGILIPGYIHESDVFTEKGIQDVRPEFKRVNVRMGGLLSIISKMYDYEHSFPYRDETFRAAVNWEPGEMIGLNGGVGVFLIPMVEISVGFSIFSKSAGGVLLIDIPSPFNYNDYKSDEMETDVSLKAAAFSLGISFYPVARGKMRPYVGSEVSYISGKIAMVEGFSYNETTYSDNTHSVSINKVEYEEKNVSQIGFSIVAGTNYAVFKDLHVFLEGNYTFARDELTDPIYMEQMVDINLSGLKVIGGIKFFF
jgi:hypothetical protein